MYYFLRQNLFEEQGIIEIVGHTEVTGQYAWTDGARFDTPVPRETLLLDPAYGTKLPDFFDTTIPVMSGRMIDALHDVGIDNFDTYPMLLRRIDTGQEFEGYSAVNFVGAVDAVNLAASKYRLRFGEPYFTGPIVIDPAKTGNLAAFRLSTGPGLVVVEEGPAKQLKSRDLIAVLLQPTEEYDGT